MQENSTPPAMPTDSKPENLNPHRGTVVLVLGILGLVCCVICGIIAWVMGKKDLTEMDAGSMDPTGRGLTQAGKICGMISVGLNILGLIIWLITMAIGIGTGMQGG